MTNSGVLDRLAERSTATGIVRWRDGRVLGGVCRGIGARYDIDPVVVRVGVAAVTLIGGVGAAAYLAAWTVLPDEDGRVPLREATSGRSGRSVALVIFAALAIVGVLLDLVDGRYGHGLPGIPVLAVLVWLLYRRRHSHRSAGADGEHGAGQGPAGEHPSGVDPAVGGTATPGFGPAGAPGPQDAQMPVITPWGGPPVEPRVVVVPRPRRRPFGFLGTIVTLGLAILAGVGADAGGRAAGLSRLEAGCVGLGTAAALVGVVALVLGLRGLRAWWLTAAAIALTVAGLSTATAAGSIPADAPVGDATWRPTSAAELDQRHALGAGDGVLDLRGMPTADLAGRAIAVQVGTGDITAYVPDDVAVDVRAKAGVGHFEAYDGGHRVRVAEGMIGTERARLGSGDRVVELTLQVGAGTIRVERTHR